MKRKPEPMPSARTMSAAVSRRAASNVAGDALKAALVQAREKYAAATKHYEAIAPCDPGEIDTESAAFTAWCDACDEADRISGKYDAYCAMRTAEEAVIQWAGAAMKSEFPTRYAEVAPVFEKYPSRPTLREKLVTICTCFRF